VADHQSEMAVTLLTSLEKQVPRSATVKFLLGVAQEQKGDTPAALAAYGAAKDMGYPPAVAAVARLTK
jgi:hypothetical protein